DIKRLLEVLPPGPDAIYQLAQQDNAVNFAYTDLTPQTAKDYLHTLYAQTLQSAVVERVTRVGNPLNTAWLTSVGTTEKGILLIEGRDTTGAPLTLEVVDSHQQKIARVELPISMASVEKML